MLHIPIDKDLSQAHNRKDALVRAFLWRCAKRPHGATHGLAARGSRCRLLIEIATDFWEELP